MRVSLGPEASEGPGARSEKHIGPSVDDFLNKEGVSEGVLAAFSENLSSSFYDTPRLSCGAYPS
jgi:hypothetical protein